MKVKKLKPLTYACKKCGKIVHFKNGGMLKSQDSAGLKALIDFKYCPKHFAEIVEIVCDYNKPDYDGVYTRARYLALCDIKYLKDLYEGKFHKKLKGD